MERLIFLLTCISIFASCSVSNRIMKVSNPNKGLKSFRLVQTPNAYFSVDNQTGQTKVKVISTYLFEERENEYPHIGVNFRIVSTLNTKMPATGLFYNLDGETIKIAPEGQMTHGRFIIPENLWVSLVHSRKIQCILKGKKEGVDMELNLPERNKLAGFFQLAMKQRDLRFPAIPEGKKKW